MELDHLVVFDSEVMTCALQMSHLVDTKNRFNHMYRRIPQTSMVHSSVISCKTLCNMSFDQHPITELLKHVLIGVHLHEEAGAERPADVGVIISAGELCAPARQVEAVHDPGQLLAHVVS